MDMGCILGKIITYCLAYFIAGYIGHFIVIMILRVVGANGGGSEVRSEAGAKEEKEDEKGESGLENAGAVIGVIERIFVLTLVLIEQYVPIGLIITAKSIVRFPELKHRKFAEYYLIGTLSSVLFALVTGILAKSLLGIICIR